MKVFLTGGAGFIGHHVAVALLRNGHSVTTIDNLNPYYDPALKQARLKNLSGEKGFRFAEGDIAVPGALEKAAAGEPYDVVLHLAAQAGVRYALKDPSAYVRSNLVGHHNVLEFARSLPGLQHLVYASSSSVYGNDTAAPYSESARADHPVSFYGATKRAGEILSHSYAELYSLKQTGLRFFTVYGPWGRPDMAYWSFTDAILNDRPVPVFGGGKLRRDFTFVDDIVDGIVRILTVPFVETENMAPHRVYNLGNSHPEDVLTLIRTIETATGKRARIQQTEGPAGDVLETYADITQAAQDFGFVPKISLREGITRFVTWYRSYYRV